MNILQITVTGVVLLLTTAAVSAQTQFMVMSAKGKVTYQDDGKGPWIAVKVGMTLDGKDIVKTSFASYAKLMLNRSRLVSIDENMTKRLAEFEALAGRNAGEATAGSILEYAAAQMNRTREKDDDPVYGAVRGGFDVFTAVFPKYAVMTTDPLFQWVDADEAQTYDFILLDDQFNTITRMKLNTDQFRYLSDSLPALSPDHQYHWRITRLSDYLESDIQTFRILPADTVAAIQDELGKLDTELTAMGADDVTLHLIRGIYFEKRGLYTDAFHEYKETIALAPDVEEYREMMRNLLFQMKLYAEEEYLLD
ncbi:MAG: hypothetical protein JXA28_06825 [Bacteroidetes bacterium]|nr:hypothetical protein [Bacteroidota bacterium]